MIIAAKSVYFLSTPPQKCLYPVQSSSSDSGSDCSSRLTRQQQQRGHANKAAVAATAAAAGAAAGEGGHPLSPSMATGTTLRGGLVHQRRSSCLLMQWATWRGQWWRGGICEYANMRICELRGCAGAWGCGGVGV
jgi:hypothetical protein